jgi:hypothetical protein
MRLKGIGRVEGATVSSLCKECLTKEHWIPKITLLVAW